MANCPYCNREPICEEISRGYRVYCCACYNNGLDTGYLQDIDSAFDKWEDLVRRIEVERMTDREKQ